MKILKFGGSSVADAECIRRVAGIVGEARREGPVAVVVSAFRGVTDDLAAAAAAAARRDRGYEGVAAALRARHLDAISELAPPDADALAARITRRLDDLDDLLHGVFLLREASPRTTDGILAYGERLSADVVAAALTAAGVGARVVDARRLIVTDDVFGHAQVDLETSYERIRETFSGLEETAVVTGFIAATPEGHTTTLGRGGSDYTAALLGAALGAAAIELWTDVDGVMSADPRMVAEAFPQPRLSYAELMELSHFGAEVVYPPSVHPARSLGIPLAIKNTFNPRAEGTLVTDETVTGSTPAGVHPIRGISSINRVALMRLEGDGMVGVPGIAMRLFGALARHRVSVILISQSSSEHSICFAVSPADSVSARRAVDLEFALERQAGIVDELIVEDDQSVIAAVGEQMRQRPGLAGRLFSVLGVHGVNVRAIAQGSSELNISLVVDRRSERQALAAIHGAFFAPRRRRLALAVAGAGRVAAALLEQLADAAGDLARREHLEIRLVALADSRRMVLDRSGIDPGAWRPRLDGDAEALDPERLRAFIGRAAGGQRVFVDCTASEDVGDAYGPLLEAGVAVVAANKLPFAGSLERFRRLEETAQRSGSALYHEATVGAGLPVLSTLADLIRTGDRLERVDGVLSGTVNAVLERLAGGEPFSAAVRAAHAEGLTEPRPWEDLSGGDVARKLCILGRLAGRGIALEDVEVEPLIEARDWRDLDAFWSALADVDDGFRRRSEEAAAAGRRLRYVASLTGAGARVALEAVAPAHPAYTLAGADNLVAFTTGRYRSPLVLRGPGAGARVTAAGVFADLLRAADRCGPS